MAITATYTSMCDVSASVAKEAEFLFDRIYNLEESVMNWGLREAHMEMLDGIAQNIIRLQLNHYEHVRKVRDQFNLTWENWGVDDVAFDALYDACANSLSQFLHPLSFDNYNY